MIEQTDVHVDGHEFEFLARLGFGNVRVDSDALGDKPEMAELNAVIRIDLQMKGESTTFTRSSQRHLLIVLEEHRIRIGQFVLAIRDAPVHYQ